MTEDIDNTAETQDVSESTIGDAAVAEPSETTKAGEILHSMLSEQTQLATGYFNLLNELQEQRELEADDKGYLDRVSDDDKANMLQQQKVERPRGGWAFPFPVATRSLSRPLWVRLGNPFPNVWPLRSTREYVKEAVQCGASGYVVAGALSLPGNGLLRPSLADGVSVMRPPDTGRFTARL